jgi:hypothetical protein
LGRYIISIGFVVFLLMVAYEYGWPRIALFDGWLRTERSRRIATVVGWVLTAGVLVMVGLRLWNTARDLWRGV